ncbi:MAG: acyl-CoA dehydrogenase family protein [bacterium]
MGNYFTENRDILSYFQQEEMEALADLVEGDYREAEEYRWAPRSAEDAVDSWRHVLESLGGLCADFIAPRAEEVDRVGCRLDEEGAVHLAPGTAEDLDMLTRAELMGFTLPRRYGGLHMPGTIYTVAIEMVSRADASLMNLFGLQGVAETINDFADDEIKEEYLPRFARGGVTGAMVLTEPDAGSDLQAIQLRARQDEEGMWRLNGVKRFITNGCGEVLLVLARSEPDRAGAMGLSLFLVDQGPAVKVRRLEEKLGIHGSPTCELQFDNTPALLIGRRQRGLITYVMALMNGARLAVAAQAVGIAQAALESALEYARVRKQFGKAIIRIPPVADMLMDMTLDVEAARALVYETSKVVDRARAADRTGDKKEAKRLDRLAGVLTPFSKYYAGEMSIRVANEAVQILGGSGYMKDYPVERYLRDARITTIYEGTSQLQVVAAIRGITSGIVEDHFRELHAGLEGSGVKGVLPTLGKAREALSGAVAFVKEEEDPDYLELAARDLVDLAIHIFIGYVLAGQARDSSRKRRLLDRWMDRVSTLSSRVPEKVMDPVRTGLHDAGTIIDGG